MTQPAGLKMGRTHCLISFDLETAAQTVDSAILSIGGHAVLIDPDTIQDKSTRSTIDSFYKEVDLNSQKRRPVRESFLSVFKTWEARHVDPETILWHKTSKDPGLLARCGYGRKKTGTRLWDAPLIMGSITDRKPGDRPLTEEGSAVDIMTALFKLSCWIQSLKECYMDEVYLMGNGAGFDIGILEHAYRWCDLPIPWDFRKVIDLRTFRYTQKLLGWEDLGVQRIGDAHNAASDARYQADLAHETVSRLLALKAREDRAQRAIDQAHEKLTSGEYRGGGRAA